jgi:hypothetical protein
MQTAVNRSKAISEASPINSSKDRSQLHAGAAKVDITNTSVLESDDPLYAGIDVARPNDRLYVKALVLKDAASTVVMVTVDAVAVAQIGTIGNDYLDKVRARLGVKFDLKPDRVMFNASHCHGVVCEDIVDRTVAAVEQAWEKMVPIRVGVGCGYEDRIMENRRLKLKNGHVADVRRAYALPANEEIADIGTVDPQIGVVRLDQNDGRTVAVLCHFACHPIQGVPNGGNTADLSGIACQVIEEYSDEGTVAFFLQGCGADINPVRYRDLSAPPDAAPLGHMLGLSTVRALKGIQCGAEQQLKLKHRTLALPRAELGPAIAKLEAEQKRLLESLVPNPLNLQTFVPLLVKYGLGGEYPADAAHRYLHEAAKGRKDLENLDDENRKNIAIYSRNVAVMEELTRVQTNLGLLRLHHAGNQAAGGAHIHVEMLALRLGAFVLITFPGELPVEIGLGIKARSPHEHTFVSGVTNGYLYYTPTLEQLKNQGRAQEDSDCLLDPSWQALFEAAVDDMLQDI